MSRGKTPWKTTGRKPARRGIAVVIWCPAKLVLSPSRLYSSITCIFRPWGSSTTYMSSLAAPPGPFAADAPITHDTLSFVGRLQALLELTKPRITLFILMSAGVGYVSGLAGGVEWFVLFHLLMGTALLASGTATLNQWYERAADARM